MANISTVYSYTVKCFISFRRVYTHSKKYIIYDICVCVCPFANTLGHFNPDGLTRIEFLCTAQYTIHISSSFHCFSFLSRVNIK